MPVYFGSNKTTPIYKGTTKIDSIYHGLNLVYKSSLLPSGYTECEYLESTGTQYIDTGINPERNSKFILNFIQTSMNTSIIGAYSNTNNRVQAFRGGNNPSVFEFRVFCGTNNADYNPNITYPANTEFNVTFDIKNLKGIVNNNVINLNDRGGSNITYPVWLFCANNAGSIATPSNAKIYSYKHYKNDVLVQYLVPCLDNNGVPCMYDLVSKTTFYNAGSGTFNYG